MVLPTIAKFAAIKGVQLVGTGDWTHPQWFAELRSALEEVGNGIFQLVDSKGQANDSSFDNVYFVLSCEIASVYSQNQKVRRIHNLVILPSFESAAKISRKLERWGAKLESDGRPIIGLSAADLVQIVLEVEPQALVIPAHIWTPWFSLYGANSGFDSIYDCFGELTRFIYAVETGLSSDPGMNWRIKELDNLAIVSFSDAHSPEKIGREATVLKIDELSYQGIYQAIVNQQIEFTVEFFPEEGKYHYSGHRLCKVSYSPSELIAKGINCPVCGKELTIGVATRVEKLSNRESKFEIKSLNGLRIIYSSQLKKPPYILTIPLLEIIAATLGMGINSKRVKFEYQRLVSHFGSELAILLKVPTENLFEFGLQEVVSAIIKVRNGEVSIKPGFDGEYGQIEIVNKAGEKVYQLSYF